MGYTWKEETINALKDLGGVAHIKDIYNQLVKRGNLDMSKGKTPRRTLSRVLQTNSLSTSYGIENVFYSVYGVDAKKGIWGLVDYTVESMGVTFTAEDTAFPEGKEVLRQHIVRERSRDLVRAAKQRFKDSHDGKLFCEICGFDFFERYGSIGADFIEAHHIKPISEMKEGETTSIDDIVLVCSNCHSMLHRKRPWITKDNLRQLIETQGK